LNKCPFAILCLQVYLICSSKIKNVEKTGAYTVTVRQLESLIRLSEAIAAVYLEDDVTVNHVQEAFSLMQASQGIVLAFPMIRALVAILSFGCSQDLIW